MKESVSLYLPSKLVEFIDAQVGTGIYSSRSDYIAHLVRSTSAFVAWEKNLNPKPFSAYKQIYAKGDKLWVT